MPQIVNIAAYRFADLDSLPELRAELLGVCQNHSLRGTILISPEGINVVVAGTRAGVEALLERVRQIRGVENLDVKKSLSSEQPFNRMLVKIKREIIAFGVEGIDPRRYASRRLSPSELRRWLDEGRPVTLLDARNNFEVEAGTFRGALAIGVDDFRDFPAAAACLPAELKVRPVVTFCTGGIRCEKAAPYLERAGFRDVYQLEGGILKYFDECGGAHYEGQCFVFDKRVALDASLQASGLQQCFVCQAILSVAEQASPEYVEGESCPRCFESPAEKREKLIARRNVALRAATAPLPGSVPYDNVRPISVPQRLDGVELLDFLDAMFTHLSRVDWQRECAAGRLVCQGKTLLPGDIVRSGQRLLHMMPATCEPDIATAIEILHEDEAIVVVHKPAPLPMHPCGRFNRNTLSYLLGQVYHPLCLRPAHRLDADTSGVVVFSKTREIARLVQPQFEAGRVRKLYLARVQGRVTEQTFECHLPLSDEPGQGGVRLPDASGAAASTRFRLQSVLRDGTSLLEVEPLTGRTNQIRAHLWKLGLPIVGDSIYLPDGKLGAAQTLSLADPPLCLHAAEIEFTHPLSRERVRYAAVAPAWATKV